MLTEVGDPSLSISVGQDITMNLQHYLSYLVQASDGQSLTDGLLQSEQEVIAINPQSGLMTMAQGQRQQDPMALRAVEVLLDDMALNLPKSTLASECLEESFDNINDYLLTLAQQPNQSQAGQGVSLIALQLMPEHLALTALGDYSCLYYSEGELELILEGSQKRLGIDPEIQTASCQQAYAEGDQLLIVKTHDLEFIEQDYVRVTLARFEDNLQMSLRQISARAVNQGSQDKPSLLICRLHQDAQTASGWLSRLRKK